MNWEGGGVGGIGTLVVAIHQDPFVSMMVPYSRDMDM